MGSISFDTGGTARSCILASYLYLINMFIYIYDSFNLAQLCLWAR